MSELLEFMLHLVGDILLGVLEIVTEGWFPEFELPDTLATRIVLGILIGILFGVIVWRIW